MTAQHPGAMPPRPLMPGGATGPDQKRSLHSYARYLILRDEHDALAEDWRDEHVDPEAADAWGPSDLSANPLAEICRQLSTPGLYGVRPAVRHAAQRDEADALIGTAGALAACGYWTKMQRVQYLALGLGEELVRLDVAPDTGELTIRLVQPHDVYIAPDPYRPDQPIELWELRLRWWAAQKRWVYTWDIFSVGRRATPDAPEVPPSYRIFEADVAGGLGEEVSNIFVRLPSGEYGAAVGEAYPYRYEDGTPFIPYVIYRSVDTGDTWNWLDRRGVHHGTLNTILYYSYAGHCARAASGNMVFVCGMVPMAANIRRGDSGTQAMKSAAILPGTVVYHEAVEGMQPFVQEIGPGGNLPDVSAWAGEYEIKQALRWGLNGSDVTRQHANPTSGTALAISSRQKREAMRQVEEVFRRADLEALRKAAALLRLSGQSAPPEIGYTITYAPIPDSPAEEDSRRTQDDWDMQHGFVSEIDVFIRRNPGASREDALDAIARSRVDRMLIDARAQEMAEEAGVTPADAPDAGGTGGESVQDTALNGAQVQAAQAIVEAVAAGRLPRDTGLGMLVTFFRIPRDVADQLVGDVGTNRFAPAEPTP